MDYIFGASTNRSFVVGLGPNPPQRPHHCAASCTAGLGERCTPDALPPNAPNPHKVLGALVAGPDAADRYQDDRGNLKGNSVSLDANAPFTGALAALLARSATPKKVCEQLLAAEERAAAAAAANSGTQRAKEAIAALAAAAMATPAIIAAATTATTASGTSPTIATPGQVGNTTSTATGAAAAATVRR